MNGRNNGRTPAAFAVVVALAVTTVLSGVAFGAEADKTEIDAADLTAAAQAYLDETGADSISAYLRADDSILGANEAPDILSAAEEQAVTDVDAKAAGAGNSAFYTRWYPYTIQNIADPANTFSQSGTMAGRQVTVMLVGKNMAQFLATAPSQSGSVGSTVPTLPVGSVAYMPASITWGDTGSSSAWSQGNYDDEWDTFSPPLTVTHTYNKAAKFAHKVYYQKWTVTQGAPIYDTSGSAIIGYNPNYWTLDFAVKYCQTFYSNVKGLVYYNGDRGKSKQVWVESGAKYPKFTTKRKGFKFGGWYTKWPTGGAKITLGKTKVWFGSGYTKTIYVHWNKKIPITYKGNGGKIAGKKTKIKKVNYRSKLGKAPSVKKSGYEFLDWYMKYKTSSGSAYMRHDKTLVVDVTKATFTAQWIKKGTGKTVTLAEYGRILKAGNKFLLNKKDVKAAIGGAGGYVGDDKLWTSYYTYIPVQKYEWSGNKGDTTVTAYFIDNPNSSLNGYLAAIKKDGGLK
jgi:hypothetical protein